MLKIRCKFCNTELESHPIQTKCCGCDNMTTITGEKISAIDLSLVEIISSDKVKNNKSSVLTKEDLEYQEARRNRKVRKMEFEIR